MGTFAKVSVQLWLLCLTMTACNVFDPFDSPTNNDQLLSAARAAFDKGDIATARQLYEKLSASDAETAGAEMAFTILDENGASMAVFMKSLSGGSSQGAAALNELAQALKTGAGETKRKNMAEAYKKVSTITTQKELRGLIRFLTAFSIAAATLAETTEANGRLLKSDIVANPTLCQSIDNLACAASLSCARHSSSKIAYAASRDLITNPSTIDLSGAPDLGIVDGALKAMKMALKDELSTSGDFGQTLDFLTLLLDAAAVGGDKCYRWALVTSGVGN